MLEPNFQGGKSGWTILSPHTSVHSGVYKSQNKPDKEILAFTFSIEVNPERERSQNFDGD